MSAVRTKEKGSSASRILVLYNPNNSSHTIPHPNIRKGTPGRDITVPAHERVVLDWDPEDVALWENSYDLKLSVDNGLINVETYQHLYEVPKEPKPPEHMVPGDPLDMQTVLNIVYGDNDDVVMGIIRMTPYMANSRKVDLDWLKMRHRPILSLAQWYLEQNIGHVERLEAIKERIKQVAEM